MHGAQQAIGEKGWEHQINHAAVKQYCLRKRPCSLNGACALALPSPYTSCACSALRAFLQPGTPREEGKVQFVYLGAAAQALLQLRLQHAQQVDEEVGLRMQRCALASQRQLHDFLPLREACRVATIGMMFMGIVITVQSVRHLRYRADWTQLSIRQAAVCTHGQVVRQRGFEVYQHSASKAAFKSVQVHTTSSGGYERRISRNHRHIPSRDWPYKKAANASSNSARSSPTSPPHRCAMMPSSSADLSRFCAVSSAADRPASD